MKNKFLLWLSLIIIFLAFQSCHAQQKPSTQSVINAFDKELSARLNYEHLHASVSVVIIKDDHIIWRRAYGYLNRDSDIPADSSTIYRIASITKTFTALLLMQLVQEGKLKLDDPVEKYLPEIKKVNGYESDEKITFQQLASHTAGLQREPHMANSYSGTPDEWENSLISCIPYTSVISKPGERFSYSNIGYALLGLALSRVTGVPYMDMVKQRILTPLHMKDTYFSLSPAERERLAQGIANDSLGRINIELPVKDLQGRGYRVPDGGLYSTSTDLSKLVLSLMGKPPLLKSAYRNIMREVPPGGKDYGIGLMLLERGVLDLEGNDGVLPGYTSLFLIERQSGYAVILMRNYNVGNINLFSAAFALLRGLKNSE